MQAVRQFPQAADFPEEPPRGVLSSVWARFLGAVQYRESLLERRAAAATGTPYWQFLGYEIKRAEIDIGLWLGRMMETADDR